MNTIIASVPGKVILHGEHAVVYGKAAIATSIGLHTTVIVTPSSDGVRIHLHTLGLQRHWPLDPFFKEVEAYQHCSIFETYEKIKHTFRNISNLSDNAKQSFWVFLALYVAIHRTHKRPFVPIDVSIQSELPLGAGLGSSAAFSVGTAAVLLSLVTGGSEKTLPQQKLISDWAFQAESLFHGKPSGIDNAICCYGSALLFREGAIIDKLNRAPAVKLLLVDTKESRNTKNLVTSLKRLKEEHPSIVEPILEAIDKVSLKCWDLLQRMVQEEDGMLLSTIQTWGELFNLNQGLLSALGVSHPSLDDICGLARNSSGLGAKLTGAGGGGFAIILSSSRMASGCSSNNKITHLKQLLEEKGYKIYEVDICVPGLRLEIC